MKAFGSLKSMVQTYDVSVILLLYDGSQLDS